MVNASRAANSESMNFFPSRRMSASRSRLSCHPRRRQQQLSRTRLAMSPFARSPEPHRSSMHVVVILVAVIVGDDILGPAVQIGEEPVAAGGTGQAVNG